MGCWVNRAGRGGPGRWHGARGNGTSGGFRPGPAASGNRAFDKYREATLRRLEEEQGEFLEFLERLRHAKDKAEFDQFMAERGRRPSGPDTAASPA